MANGTEPSREGRSRSEGEVESCLVSNHHSAFEWKVGLVAVARRSYRECGAA